MAINLTQDTRNRIIMNATDKSAGLKVSVRMDLILSVKDANPGTEIKTTFGDFVLSENYNAVINAIGWNKAIT